MLAKAQANRAMATELATRYKPLAEAKAISAQDYVNAEAQRLQAEADVAAGNAAVQTAKLNLAYAHVTAPIAGRIGRAPVTEGALVSAAEATLLATIQQIGTVYVNFTQPNAEVLRLRKAMAANQLRKRRQRHGGRGAHRARRRQRAAAPGQAAVQRPVGRPHARAR